MVNTRENCQKVHQSHDKFNTLTEMIKIHLNKRTLFVGIDRNRLKIVAISTLLGWSAMLVTFLLKE